VLLKQLTRHYQQQVDKALKQLISTASSNAVNNTSLHQAMHYSVFNGGKRIRPLLVYLTGQALGLLADQQDAPACAVELIHCYSLVHDDMPEMDNDNLRRGKPTCHKQFSQEVALLTGDALQTLAFEALTHKHSLSDKQIVLMVNTLAQASGVAGMAGGQALDLSATGKQLSLEALQTMHEHKTGALIRASVRLGALCLAEIDETQLNTLDQYAQNIGLAFQIKDDILDIESDTDTLGKQQGADISLDKATYPSLLGLEGAKTMALECHQKALQSLSNFDHHADPLRELAKYIITRDH